MTQVMLAGGKDVELIKATTLHFGKPEGGIGWWLTGNSSLEIAQAAFCFCVRQFKSCNVSPRVRCWQVSACKQVPS